MSDENLMQPGFPDDACDECAPTERAPACSTPGQPVRGVALSVLWWLETDARRQPVEDGSES
ncbi:MAG TPA: hypothetical protein VLT33_52235 [Labilithrix sp.]|nr:hypothetical protein [Labilithrix sp.]